MAMYLDFDEAKRLARACSSLRERAILMLEMTGGLKHRHVAWLRFAHVCDERYRIREWIAIPRSEKKDAPPKRWQRIPHACRRSLLQYLFAEGIAHPQCAVFPSTHEVRDCLTPRRIGALITELFERADVERPHPGHALIATYWHHWNPEYKVVNQDWADAIGELPYEVPAVFREVPTTTEINGLSL